MSFCGCGLGFGLLKRPKAKNVAGEDPAPPQGPRVVRVDQPSSNKTQYYAQLAEILHPLDRSGVLELLRGNVFEPASKSTKVIDEKGV